MDELEDARFMAVRASLRRYYNGVMEIEDEDAPARDDSEKEKLLIALDNRFTKEILERARL